MKKIMLSMLLAGLCGCYSKIPEKTGLKGKPVPSFNLLLADSVTKFNTNSIPAGKPFVLFYFGPHCPYSHAQMEEIIDDMDKLKNIQFYIFTAASFGEMKDFYKQYQLQKYENIKCGVDYTTFFRDYFEAPGVPYLAIYGKNKKLNEAFIGKVFGGQIKNISDE